MRSADDLSPADWEATTAGWQAECQGDPVRALAEHERVAAYDGCSHRRVLQQLAELVDELPGWVWSRWAVYICGRQGSGDADDERHHRALDRTLLAIYADVCHLTRPEDKAPEQFLAELIGNDWVYRQLRTYEYGGLRAFLAHTAGVRLRSRATRIDEWVNAEIGAYQVEEQPDGGVVVTDLSVGEVVAVLDIGSEMVTEPGGFLIGRLVPIDERPGLVFESPPLAVDEQSAREIAALRPAGLGDRWVDVLARARASGRVASDFARAFRDSVVTDVEPTLLLVSGNQEGEFAGVVRRSEAGEDEVGRAAFRLLKCAWMLEARLRDEAIACLPLLTASILWPGVFARARAELTQEYRYSGWAMFARAAAEPAASRFAELALLSGPERRTA